ncbi:hypothetical protein TCSYLVIO_004104 [Trypanosoma cruzi]|nr:hypothetical protein TCSYLVIO_004104 [Trypanosoma cruzi]
MPLPFRTFPLEDDSGAEDQVLHFLALDVDTWAPRVWNDVVSGVLVDLRCAYGYYWHRGDAHAQIAFDGFVSCRRALEIDRESTDQFMDFGRALPQTFRMLIAIRTDPSISRPPQFVPAFTWPFTRLTRSRGWLGLSWIAGEPDHHNSDLCGANCVVFMETRLLHATCAPKGVSRTTDERQETAKGLLAAYGGGGKQPHPFHHPPFLTQGIAPCR